MEKRAFLGALVALVLCVSPLLKPDGAISDTSSTCAPPAFVAAGAPPLVMLVMGRDHKLYYEAYNDASDLDGDGVPDVGYKPGKIDYYGYFDNNKCYVYSSTNTRFEPNSIASNKTCSGTSEWSGDFLNYLTMSRMDCLRKVLYGGYRSTDTSTTTVLQRVYVPQDAHTWGKEYKDVATDGYDIQDYTPLELPELGTRHLFASTTLSDNGTPILRVLPNNSHRIWEWVSKERPVADSSLVTSGGNYTSQPANHSEFESLVNQFATTTHLEGSGAPSNGQINGSGNPYGSSDYYLHLYNGSIYITTAGTYTFAVDGDDAEEVIIDGTVVAGWYGGHSKCTCYTHSGTITLTAGLHTIQYRHQETTGSDNYYLYWSGPDSSNTWQLVPAATFRDLIQSFYNVQTPASQITDYTVRVLVCSPTMLEESCELYSSGYYKPVGLLQKYGESGRMNFGLITGSYAKNTSGGVLRKNVGVITDEINSSTGQYLTSAASRTYISNGIISSIDKLRIVGYDYSSYSYNVNCGWITTQPIQEGQCRMWGNPIGEMMYEALRYFAGAGATSAFQYTGTTDDSNLGLPLATWTNPYSTYPYCAKPFMLVISDINPTFDSDQLPGTAFGSFSGSLSSTSGTAMNVQTLADTISTTEVTPGDFFIGQSQSNSPTSDSSCSAKTVTSLGNIRGLCPEDPTKQGSYYAASVAYFGHINDLNSVTGDQKVTTYAVALASPLPRIEITVPAGSDHKVTLVPFAKSVGGSGYSISAAVGAFQPTNQIVDFYIETLTDTYGRFRINYEDVEQGADHDMDAIVIYEYTVSGSTVTVKLTSEYAAGSIYQHMGYIISGTTLDGTYLEVRDYDTSASVDPDYFLDTPPGQPPYPNNVYLDGTALPLTATRVFTAGSTPPATLLTNPLWYAAKWGGFTESDTTATTPKPDTTAEWDQDGDGVPDNYYYVANPLKLYEQLDKAFLSIVSRGGSAGAVATVTQQVEGEDIVVRGAFTSYEDDPKQFVWKGHLEAYWPYEGCSEWTSETSCTANAGCSWVSDAGCGTICQDLKSEATCAATQGCSWEAARCAGSSTLYSTCSEKLTTSACELTSGCEWQSSAHCEGLIYAFQRSTQSDEFCSEHHDHCWDAAEHMPAESSRTIYTMLNGIQRSFESATICTGSDLLKLSGDGEFTTDDCSDMVSWVRGSDSWSKGRNRDGWALGDVVYSTPVVVQAPSLSAVATAVASENCSEDIGQPCEGGCDCSNTTCVNQCFYCYRECQAARTKMIYVGANDGMIHAFVAGVYWQDPNTEIDTDGDGTADESHFIHDPDEPNSLCDGLTCTGKENIGKEVWAFIPSNLLPVLKELARSTYGNEAACQHRYMVDLSPTAFDVYIDPTGGTNPKWRTVIVGGERGGGDVFFAIDVTDPTNPIVLWEYPVFRNLAQVAKVSGNYLASYPYLTKSIYDQVAELPASWSIPYVGKLDLDSSVSFLAADRINTWTSGTPTLSISSRGSSNLSGWYAVVGHAPRIFSLDDLPSLSTDADVAKAQKLATLKPSLLLLDIQKGINIFQYTWPLMQATLTDLWPDTPAGDPSGTTYIPYATASPTVLDIWDSHGSFYPNGTMDHIYIGDLNGNFYGLKFNLETDSNATTAAKGIQMDVWRTKPVATADVNSNFYRSSYEPISVAPVVSTNEEYTNLLVYYGTGKYEDIQSTYNDKTDTAKMSFYSLKDDVTRPTISVSTTATKLSDSPTLFSMSGSTTSGFNLNGVGMQVTTHCNSPTYNSSCTWTTTDGTADCCESDCTSSCYACLYNLNFEGERVVDSALVAGGLVFFTTFVPKSDLCSVGGDAYLYIFSYLCVPLTSDPLADSGFSGTTLESLTSAGQYAAVGAGYVAKLGSGMPSRPVLDSSGEYVFIQTSDAQIHKIKVDLPVKPMELKGWKNEN